jgi:DNA helicase-2/ATP-dependent DNA helicase PcrA
VVFLPGWEEELFPHKKSMEEGGSNALEEERRLAYVAITRAKQKLYITTAISRLIYGEWRQMQPSRFFNEIPSECLDIHANQSAYYKGGYGSGYSSGYRSYGGYNSGYKKKKTFSTKPSYQRYDEDEYTYEPDDYADYDSDMSSRTSSLIGVRVYHESFGYGKITAVSGQNCEVNFEKYGRKKVMGTYLHRA